MWQTALWALGIGLALVGVGYTLYYQGEVWKDPKKAGDISKKAICIGRLWVGVGFGVFILGFIVFLICQFASNLIGC